MKNKKLHIWIALVVIAFFVCLAIFGCGDSIKGIRDMRFGIDIRGGVEAVSYTHLDVYKRQMWGLQKGN